LPGPCALPPDSDYSASRPREIVQDKSILGKYNLA
jgi:hypothetical protein